MTKYILRQLVHNHTIWLCGELKAISDKIIIPFFTVFISIFLFFHNLSAQPSNPGDIAFVAYNSDGEDGFAFVTFVDIPVDSDIFFSDNEWNELAIGASGAFIDSNEGVIKWTNSTNCKIEAGTVIYVVSSNLTASIGTVIEPDSNFNPSGTDEVIYAYAGSMHNQPSSFLAAIGNDDFSTIGKGSLVNTGLKEDSTAIRLDHKQTDADVAVYAGGLVCNAPLGDCLVMIADASNNWVTDNGTGDQSQDGADAEFPIPNGGGTGIPDDFTGTALISDFPMINCPPDIIRGDCLIEYSEDFESGDINTTIWNDSGDPDSQLENNQNRASSGTYSFRLRDDNALTSFFETDTLDLSTYSQLAIQFSYLARSFDNNNEDFWLQLSYNGGMDFFTIEEWNLNDEFVNNVFENDVVIKDGPFTDQMIIRFRMDASGDADFLNLDDIIISDNNSIIIPDPDMDAVEIIAPPAELPQYSTSHIGDMIGSQSGCPGDSIIIERTYQVEDTCGRISQCTQLIKIVSDTIPPMITCPIDTFISGCSGIIDMNDFESGLGIWNVRNLPASNPDSYLSTDGSYANSGINSIALQDNDPNNSHVTTSNLALSIYDQLIISFSYYVVSFDNANEDFWLQISTDGGVSYTTKEEWNLTDEFDNHQRHNESVSINGPFTDMTRIRFRSDASGNQDWVYLDDISIVGIGSGEVPAVNLAQIVVSDNCSNSAQITVTHLSDTFSGGLACGTDTLILMRSFVAEDMCSNRDTCVQLIRFLDTIAPIWDIIPGSLDTLMDCIDDSFELIPPSATDNCNGRDVIVTKVSDIKISGVCDDKFTRVISWEATDICGNKSEVFITNVIVKDSIAPIIDCPDTLLISGCSISDVPTTTALASDNCDDNVDVTFLDMITGSICDTSIVQRTFTATDDCGNTSSCIQIIKIVDEQSPSITIAPGALVVDCTNSIPMAGVAVSDNCSVDADIIIIERLDTIATICANSTKMVRTITAIDTCNNIDSIKQEILQLDNDAPSFVVAPADITVDCQNIPLLADVMVMDNCGMTIISSSERNITGSCNDEYTIQRVWRAMDACMNIDSVVQLITVIDTLAPIFDNIPTDTIVDCNRIPTAQMVTALDPCSNVSVMVDYLGEKKQDGSCPNEYLLVRSWRATDMCGNSDSISQTLRVQDTIAPVFVRLPSDTLIQCNGMDQSILFQNWLAAMGQGVASDSCSSVSWATSPTNPVISNGCIGTGLSDVWFIITDECGNRDSAMASFSFIDTIAPTFTKAPSDMVVECDGLGNVQQFEDWTDSLGGAEVIDICSDISLYTNPEPPVLSVSCGQAGEYSIHFIAEDACGNKDSAKAMFTIVDTQAPTTICISTIDLGCNPPATDYAADNFPDWTDVCSNISTGVVIGTIVSNGCYRNVTHKYWSTDDCNNSDTCLQTLSWIEDIEGPIFDQAPNDTLIDCLVSLPIASISAIDLCPGNVTIQYIGADTIDLFCVSNKNIIRKWSAKDSCDNVSFYNQTIMVRDTVSPIFMSIPKDSSVSCIDISYPATPIFADQCSDVSLTRDSVITLGCGSSKTITYNFKATDACGNLDSLMITWMVIDTIDPYFDNPPADTIVDCHNLPSVPVVTAIDNCNSSTSVDYLGEAITNVLCDGNYTLTRTWKAIDLCGNEKAFSQILTVQDTTPPTIVCADQLILTGCSVMDLPTTTFLAVTDNCDNNVAISNTDRVTGTSCDTIIVARIFKATDACENVDSCIQIIKIIDDQSPTLSIAPGALNVDCTMSIPMAGVMVADNCSDVADIILSERLDTIETICPNSTKMVRTIIARDTCNNVDSIKQQILQLDNAAPSFVVAPADITVDCQNIPLLADVVVSDNCGMTVISSSERIITSSCDNEYTIERVWRAEDDCDNVDSVVQIITVIDTLLPEFIDVPSDTTVNCDVIPAIPTVNAIDQCSDLSVLVSYLGEMRLDRSCPNEYLLVRSWRATDGCGNSISKSQIISVQDTTPPVYLDNANDLDLVINCESSYPDPLPKPKVSDNCDMDASVLLISDQITSGTGQIDETRLLKYIAVDDCSNQSDTFDIEIVINKKPLITGQDITICYGQMVDLRTLIDEELLGDVHYGIGLGKYPDTITNIVTPTITTTYIVRDSFNIAGCVDTAMVTINVLPLPVLEDIDVTYCSNEAMNINLVSFESDITDSLGLFEYKFINETCPDELFFSEYVEGSSNNKCLEIYNGTNSDINLSSYSIELYFNGNTSAGRTIALSGIVDSKSQYVVCENSMFYNATDAIHSNLDFNGDDAIILKNSGVVVDAIGQIGNDPGNGWQSGSHSTYNKTLRRKKSIIIGDKVTDDTYNPALEWDLFDIDDLAGLGSHIIECPKTYSPVVNPKSVDISNGDSYLVIFTDDDTFCTDSATIDFVVNVNPSIETIVFENSCPSMIIDLKSLTIADNNNVIGIKDTNYYHNLFDAQNDINNLSNTYITASDTIYIRYSVNNCIDIDSIYITINPCPENCSISSTFISTDCRPDGSYDIKYTLDEFLPLSDQYIAIVDDQIIDTLDYSLSNDTFCLNHDVLGDHTSNLSLIVIDKNSGGLLITEIMADPKDDTNGDGTIDITEDEFLEIYNNSGLPIDLDGFYLTDKVGIIHTFQPTILGPGQVLVLFGGGAPTGFDTNINTTVSSQGKLGLNNAGDKISLYNKLGLLLWTHTYGTEGGDDQSLVNIGSNVFEKIENIDSDISHDAGIVTDSLYKFSEGFGGHVCSDTIIFNEPICPVLDTFDLAIKKTIVNEGPYNPGDTVEFIIEVFNQGNITAYELVIYDGIPEGLIFDELINDSNWLADSTYSSIDSIAPDGSKSITINLIIDANIDPNDIIINSAEILESLTYKGIKGIDKDGSLDIIGGGQQEIDNEINDNELSDSQDDYDLASVVLCSSISIDKPYIEDISYCSLSDFSNPITLQPVAYQFATDLVISEYIEGSFENKCIELYNNTGRSVDLKDYQLHLYVNGGTTASKSLNLSGDLAHDMTFTICNDDASTDLIDVAQLLDGGTMNFNGNDVIVLTKNSNIVDAIGQIGATNNFGKDKTLVRVNTVIAGDNNPYDSFDASIEWVELGIDQFTGFGEHNMTTPLLTKYNFYNNDPKSGGSLICKNQSTCDVSLTLPGQLLDIWITSVIGNCESEATKMSVGVHSEGEGLTCIGQINLTVDEDCSFDISTILSANGVVPQDLFKIEIYNDANELITTLNNSDQHESLKYHLIDLCTGNICWGEVNLESKRLAEPIIDTPDTICCNQSIDTVTIKSIDEIETWLNSSCFAPHDDIVKSIRSEGSICDTINYSIEYHSNFFLFGEQKNRHLIYSKKVVIVPLQMDQIISPGSLNYLDSMALADTIRIENCREFEPLPNNIASYWANRLDPADKNNNGDHEGIPYAYPYIYKGDQIISDTTSQITDKEILHKDSLVYLNGYWVKLDIIEHQKDTSLIISNRTISEYLPISPTNTCNMSVKYSDFEYNKGCWPKSKIFRSWTVIDWCSKSTELFEQWIIIEDIQKPIFGILPVNVQIIGLDSAIVNGTDTVPIDQIGSLVDVDQLFSIVNIDNPYECSVDYEIPHFSKLKDNCSEYEDLKIEFEINSTSAYFDHDNYRLIRSLSVGTHILNVTATDLCGNAASHEMTITVLDKAAPIAYCDRLHEDIVDTIKTFLFDDFGYYDGGIARVPVDVFDSESYDACGEIQLILARRLDNNFICGDSLISWISTEYLEFCCEDIGKAIPIHVTLFDDFGNSSSCETVIIIEGVSRPKIQCIDLELGCEPPYYQDLLESITLSNIVCDTLPITFEPALGPDKCGYGEEYLSVYYNGVPTCEIHVTYNGEGILDPYQIKWPIHYDGKSHVGKIRECKTSESEGESMVIYESNGIIDHYDYLDCSEKTLQDPVWCNSTCGLVASSYELDTIIGSGVCYGIIKTWTIIDWCTWKPNADITESANLIDRVELIDDTWLDLMDSNIVGQWLSSSQISEPSCKSCDNNNGVADNKYYRYSKVLIDGYYSYEQIILINDDEAPQINLCQSQINFSSQNCTASVELKAVARDIGNCIGDVLNYQLELFDEEEPVFEKSLFNVNQDTLIMSVNDLPIGDYKALWKISDYCGNSSYCEESIIIKDDAAPIPYCLSSVNINLNSVGEASIWVDDVDLGSYDDCSSIEMFFIIDSMESQSLNISCDDITVTNDKSVYRQVWFKDSSGNQSSCDLQIVVGNPTVCDNSMISIRGIITTVIKEPMKDVSVSGMVGDQVRLKTSTDDRGKYIIEAGYAINSLHPEYDLNPMNGVSTLDLILIQSHILGLLQLDHPFKIIAADANNSGHISALDLIDIRKLILGINSQFANNRSWRFIDRQVDMDEGPIFPFVEDIMVYPIRNSYDYVGLKIGDVDQSAKMTSKSNKVNRTKVNLNWIPINNRIEFHFENSNVQGIQLEISGLENELRQIGSDIFECNHNNWNQLSNGNIRIILHELRDENLIVNTNGPLFYLEFDDVIDTERIDLENEYIQAELYLNHADAVKIYDISLQKSETKSELEYLGISPNPFAESTKLLFAVQENSEVELVIYSAIGQVIYSSRHLLSGNNNSISIDKNQLIGTGIYHVNIKTKDGDITDQILFIQ